MILTASLQMYPSESTVLSHNPWYHDMGQVHIEDGRPTDADSGLFVDQWQLKLLCELLINRAFASASIE
jgi:hypothetical protein